MKVAFAVAHSAGSSPLVGPASSTAEARGASWVVVARHRSRLGELARGFVASRLHRLLRDTRIDIVRREGLKRKRRNFRDDQGGWYGASSAVRSRRPASGVYIDS
jgi:hypothetical protein